MAGELEDFGRITMDSARKVAAAQANVVAQYGNILHEFGRGDMSVGRYGALLVSFYLNQSSRYAEEVASIGADYVQSAVRLAARPAEDIAASVSVETARAAKGLKAGAAGRKRTAKESKPAEK